MVLKRTRALISAKWQFRRRWNYMVLKHFVKSLDFRLQCWVWKKIKLHGTQTIQFHLYVTHSIWRGVKLQGSQTCYCAAKTKKLQGTQTFTGWSLRQQRVWQKIKLHDSQTFSLLFPLWRRAKLHDSQTAVQTLTGFDGVWNYMVLKHRCRRRSTIFGFGEE